MHQGGERPADQILRRPGAEQLERLGVGERHPSLAVGEQRDRAELDQAPIAFLALAQGRLGRLELGDVDADPVPDHGAVVLPGRRREGPEPVELAAAQQDPVVARERRQPRGRFLDRRQPARPVLGVHRVLQQLRVVGHRLGIEAMAQLDLRAVVGIGDPAVRMAHAAIDHARDVVDDAAQQRLARAQLLGLALQLGDVAVQGDEAALGGAVVGDAQPAAIGELALERLAVARVLAREALRHPGLLAPDRLRDAAGPGEAARQLRKAHARPDGALERRIEVAIALVGEHQTVLGVPQREAVRHALDRLAQPGFGFPRAGFALAQRPLDPSALLELRLQTLLRILQLGAARRELARGIRCGSSAPACCSSSCASDRSADGPGDARFTMMAGPDPR